MPNRLHVRATPSLDGGAASLGDDARPLSVRIPAGEYPTPFWLRTEAGLVIRVDELPWQGVFPIRDLEVLSTNPAGAGGLVPDPEGLPDAVASSAATSTAGALAAGPMAAAGGVYTDAQTGVRVVRVTDPTTPAANTGGGHDYSAGGPYCSQVWESGGAEYVTLGVFLPNAQQLWFVDLNLSSETLHDWRQGPGRDVDTGLSFSLDAATPRHCFYCQAGTIHRYDTTVGVMADDHTGRFANFPHNPSLAGITVGGWVQTTDGDVRILWQHAFDPADLFVVINIAGDGTITEVFRGTDHGVAWDEAKIDPTGKMLLGSGGNPVGSELFDIDGGVSRGFESPRHSTVHSDIGRGYAVWMDADATIASPSGLVGATCAPATGLGTPTSLEDGSVYAYDQGGGLANSHESAGWVFGNGSGADQWFLTSGDNTTAMDGNGEAPWFLTLYHPQSGKIKHLCYADNRPGGSYFSSAHGHLQPNGRAAMFNSVMNNDAGARADLFVAILPTKAA